jgi:proteic killer suppression protein
MAADRTDAVCSWIGAAAIGAKKAPSERNDVRCGSIVIQYRFTLRSTVIRSFADKRTAAIFAGYAVRDLPPQIQRRGRAKLLAIDAAKQLTDLRAPPGNRLEMLHGDRQGQSSIRINDQRCFIWRDGEAWDVEIVDYH